MGLRSTAMGQRYLNRSKILVHRTPAKHCVPHPPAWAVVRFSWSCASSRSSCLFCYLSTCKQRKWASAGYVIVRLFSVLLNITLSCKYALHRIPSIFASVIQLRLMLEDRAGGGVDLIAVLHAAGLELDLVDEYSILIVQFDIHVIRFIFTHTRVI